MDPEQIKARLQESIQRLRAAQEEKDRTTTPKISWEQFQNLTAILTAAFPYFDPGAKLQRSTYDKIKYEPFEDVFAQVHQALTDGRFSGYWELHPSAGKVLRTR